MIDAPALQQLISVLCSGGCLSKSELAFIIENRDASVYCSDKASVPSICSTSSVRSVLAQKARNINRSVYGNKVFIRGLIECSSFCKNNCLYCGIRCANKKAQRYRLSKKEILECCQKGNAAGFKTFVLQGGEDNAFSPAVTADIVSSIKSAYPDCAVTLSLGEQSFETYRLWKDAGADRYLLRHESANKELYEKLHAEDASYRTFEYRKDCLFSLKQLGYQVGSGFMCGAPYQTIENLAEDLIFLRTLNPQMIGIGPFIPHKQTSFSIYQAGTAELTTFMISLLRIMFPHALIPATTALATIATDGREKGILSGANVVMPNISPTEVRSKYNLYDNKRCTNDEAIEGLQKLQEQMKSIGYTIVSSRGDYLPP